MTMQNGSRLEIESGFWAQACGVFSQPAFFVTMGRAVICYVN